MSIKVEYRVMCDAKGGLCREQTREHDKPDHAIWEALELGWALTEDGEWRCPKDHGKKGAAN